MISVYTRHSAGCVHLDNPYYRRCRCPRWIQGVGPDGKFIRHSAKTRSWEKAEDQARRIEGKQERAMNTQVVPTPQNFAIADAVTHFLADKKATCMTVATIGKLETIFRKQLLAWAEAKGLHDLAQLTLPVLMEWRNSWRDGSISKAKKQERVRSFFRFCQCMGWLKSNPAAALSRIKVTAPPTDYFTRAEFEEILQATYIYDTKSVHAKEITNNASRLRILTLLLRWSGLRIRDAVCLERCRLVGDSILLYTAKTGTPVYVPIPPDLAQALRNIPPGPKPNPRYFFWSGNGDPKSAVADWQRAFRRLFEIAGIKHSDGRRKRCYAHMFRDTFAVELLLAGVTIEQVSVLLGHSSIRVTEKSYAPWVRARQEQLESAVRKAWPGNAGTGTALEDAAA